MLLKFRIVRNVVKKIHHICGNMQLLPCICVFIVLCSVKVNFESKQSNSASSVVLDVNPNATCLQLKKMVRIYAGNIYQ